MPTRRDLLEKHGGKLREAVNREIRAEVPGGNELLDAIHLIRGAAVHRTGVHAAALKAILPSLEAAKDRLAESILSHYGEDPSQ